jgi:leucyl/phenylalanyl-tRNA--protein transferase
VNRLAPELLLHGYAAGIFPMAEARASDEIYWVEPRERAIIPLNGFHLSRSLARTLRSGRFTVTCDVDFSGVIAGCADRPETWINGAIEQSMMDLHALGFAHSLEVWEGAPGERLAGGIYGVALGRAFFGESMFSRVRDGSKVALAWLVARLKAGRFSLLDCQFMTDHLASLGAVSVPRDRYVALLSAAVGSAGTAGGAATGAVSAAAPRSGGAAREPGADFRALDTLLVAEGAAGIAGASGKLITQLLGQTS